MCDIRSFAYDNPEKYNKIMEMYKNVKRKEKGYLRQFKLVIIFMKNIKERDTTHDDILIVDAPKKKKKECNDEYSGSYGDDRMKEIAGY